MGKKEIILKLRNEGKKHREIAELLNCNQSLIYYYLEHDKNLEKFKDKRKNKEFNKIRVNSVNKSKARNRKVVLDYLETHSCVDCGITDVRVLEFDHVRGTKIDCVSVGVKDSWSVEKLIEEINKCEVRCANCHKIMTDTRRKHKKVNQ
jgi:predicted transcriptional regulator